MMMLVSRLVSSRSIPAFVRSSSHTQSIRRRRLPPFVVVTHHALFAAIFAAFRPATTVDVNTNRPRAGVVVVVAPTFVTRVTPRTAARNPIAARLVVVVANIVRSYVRMSVTVSVVDDDVTFSYPLLRRRV